MVRSDSRLAGHPNQRSCRVSQSQSRSRRSSIRIAPEVDKMESELRADPDALMSFWLGTCFRCFIRDASHRFALGLPMPGALSYWVTQGRLPLGTPLTDADGRVLSFVGLRHKDHPSFCLFCHEMQSKEP